MIYWLLYVCIIVFLNRIREEDDLSDSDIPPVVSRWCFIAIGVLWTFYLLKEYFADHFNWSRSFY